MLFFSESGNKIAFKARVRAALQRRLEKINTILTFPFFLFHILRHLRVIKNAEILIIMDSIGFGHTVYAPEIARCVYINQKSVIIFLSHYRRHNWKISAIWPDISVLFLPINIGFIFKERVYSLPAAWYFRNFIKKFITRLALFLTKERVKILDGIEMYKNIPTDDQTKANTKHLDWNYSWAIRYFQLRKQITVKPANLPDRWRKLVNKKLNSLGPHFSSKKRCGLYLRQKGLDDNTVSSIRRIGSPLNNYLPAIRLLNEMGYQVLLTGDIILSSSMFHEFKGMFVDYKNLGVNKDIYNLFATLEIDISICEAGGGNALPALKDIPRLYINAFPYFNGMSNAWFYYKTIRDSQNNNLVPLQELLTTYAYENDFHGMKVCCASTDQILEAVSTFLKDVQDPKNLKHEQSLKLVMPKDIWFPYTNTKISPAFLRLYEVETGEVYY